MMQYSQNDDLAQTWSPHTRCSVCPSKEFDLLLFLFLCKKFLLKQALQTVNIVNKLNKEAEQHMQQIRLTRHVGCVLRAYKGKQTLGV